MISLLELLLNLFNANLLSGFNSLAVNNELLGTSPFIIKLHVLLKVYTVTINIESLKIKPPLTNH